VGDTLLTADAGPVWITGVTRKDSVTEVYNFEVEDNHNYYVGEDGVLVHNGACFFGMMPYFIVSKNKNSIIYH
jgi:hypothetical protein